MSNSVNPNLENTLKSDVMPMLHHAAEQADDLLERGAKTLRDKTEQVQAGVQRAEQHVSDYVRGEPVKALLIAAATGAVLIGMVSLLMRNRSTGRGH